MEVSEAVESNIQNKEINILLLGETGVGKSTFINAFANYLSYETLEEAANGETLCLIPTKFVVTDANFEQQDVKYGNDKNEALENDGQSVTQECRAYCFKHGDVLVRLIDTPGVGDTRGLEMDKVNFEHMLSFIAEYDSVHLICILLKPDMPRLTSSFKYCLKQLLCHLQKEASENMVFVFTNARSTFYRPKNTLVLLKQILNDIKSNKPNVVIPIEKNTMYCFDNDSFQFLIALRNGITFADDEIGDYAMSWTKSVNECMRLINYISSGKDGQPLRPHSIQHTLSINETRRLIVALNKPIVKITKKIGDHVKELEKTMKELESFTGDIQSYIEGLKASEYLFEATFWDYVPIVQLFTITYKDMRIKKAQKDQAWLKEQLTDASDNVKVTEELVQQLQNVIDDYDLERKRIVESSAKFAYFLKNNAIATYNDSYKEYLLEQIENLKRSFKSEEKRNEEMKNLKKILNDYEEEKNILDENIKKGIQVDTEVSVENINTLIKELYKLKFSGKEIEKLHEESKSKQGLEVKQEVVHWIKAYRVERIFNSLKSWF